MLHTVYIYNVFGTYPKSRSLNFAKNAGDYESTEKKKLDKVQGDRILRIK
jgi:hypothetical protein